MSVKIAIKSVWKWRNLMIVLFVPILLLPIVIADDSKVSKCAYGVIIMAIFWVTEVIPIAVTSLLPVVIFPMLGVISARDICRSYVQDTLMLFLGSLVVAVAVERWDLHRRVALRALTLVGPEPKWLMLGIMAPCWFLSMWMSNTATTAMMVPILNAILTQIKQCKENDELEAAKVNDEQEEKISTNGVTIIIEMDDLPIANGVKTSSNVENRAHSSNEFIQLAKAFALCTAYAANCGGVATLTGTPPNIVLKGQADLLFAKYNLPSGITFANWLVLGFPLSLVCVILTWFWLQLYYSGKRCLYCCGKGDKGSYESVRKYIRKEYDGLGPMSFAEKSVLLIFIILAVLWVTRKPEFMPGWGMLFEEGFVGDSTPAVLISILLFVFPSRKPMIFCCGRKKDATGNINGDPAEDLLNIKNYTPLLNWRLVNEKMAWGVLLLMGGGFAMADACSVSGLSGWISDRLTVLSVLRPWLIGLLLSYIVAGITNFTSNSATATLFLPIVGELAIRLSIHPLYFMIPVAIATSFAFLLPVGTPPNAIVFSTGFLQVKDMISGGFIVNIVTVLLLVSAMNFYGVSFYGLDKFPMEMTTNLSTPGPNAGNITSVLSLAYNISSAG